MVQGGFCIVASADAEAGSVRSGRDTRSFVAWLGWAKRPIWVGSVCLALSVCLVVAALRQVRRVIFRRRDPVCGTPAFSCFGSCFVVGLIVGRRAGENS